MNRLGTLAQDADAAEIPRLDDDEALAKAIESLRIMDPALDAAAAVVGPLPRRTRPATFAGLAAIVIGQQVSTASAEAIGARLMATVQPFEAVRLPATTDAELRTCGLSAGKIRTLRAIATAIGAGRLSIPSLASLGAEAARTTLLALPGIGPWTADIFLLFCLGHADAWPAGDLALQEAARELLGRPQRPDATELTRLAERWRPYRGAAATLLWAYYRVRKRPVDATARPAAFR